ncbi:MAG: GNAT family N-acetyltransferase [Bacillota bacterium]
MITVRLAELSDVEGISCVHRSDITHWVKQITREDGLTATEPSQWSELTLADRWNHGGPWMSPELCMIHLNRLRLLDQFPLVAEQNGRIVGELEMIVGDDAEFGINANLSVLYVDRALQGQGIGSLLMNDAIDLAQEIGCHTVTTYAPAVPAFYQRFGLEPVSTYSELTIATSAAQPALAVRRTRYPEWAKVADLPLLFGRILSSYQTWLQLDGEREPGLYAIPMHSRPAAMDFSVTLPQGRAYVALRDISGQYEEAAVHAWSPSYEPELIATILAQARRLGIARLRFLMDPNLATVVQKQFTAEPTGSVPIYNREL